MTRPVRLALVLAGVALCLAGCGRRNDLRQAPGGFYPHHYPDIMFPDQTDQIMIRRVPSDQTLPPGVAGSTTFQDLKVPGADASAQKSSSDQTNASGQTSSATKTDTNTNTSDQSDTPAQATSGTTAQ